MAFIRRTRWTVSETSCTNLPLHTTTHHILPPHSPHVLRFWWGHWCCLCSVSMSCLLWILLSTIELTVTSTNTRSVCTSIIPPLSAGQLMTALQDRGAGLVTGEKSMKQFINLRMRSSKTGVEVHVGNDLVKQLVLKKLIRRFNCSVLLLRSTAAAHGSRGAFTWLCSMRPL